MLSLPLLFRRSCFHLTSLNMPRLQVAAYWTAIDEDRIGHVTMGEFCRRALLVAW